jgi:hypothetical protein
MKSEKEIKRYSLKRVTTGISDDLDFVECNEGEYVMWEDVKDKFEKGDKE